MCREVPQAVGSAVLHGFPFMDGCSDAARRLVADLPSRTVAPRTRVLRRGDPVDGVFLVTSGTLRVYHLTAEGREATLYRVRPGETCILALTAAFRREQYPAWVETEATPLRFALLPGEEFRRLYDQEPAFRGFVFEVLSGRVFELMSRLEELGSLSLEQRLAAFLLAEADGAAEVAMSQARLAAHLGTAREVVSRSVRSLAACGLVATSRGRIRLLDVPALRERAGH
jgi:CRP/FNR family transcriptional regulator